MKKRIISFISAVSIFLTVSNAFKASADEITVKGDVNADGRFTIADAVTFHKWLLAVPNAELANWKAADFNDDGTVDIFDFCILRQELIEKYELNTDEKEADNSNIIKPGAVYTSLNVSYEEAKERFGYDIVKCTHSDFCGYNVGIVSQYGKIDSKEAFCWNITYEFTNGQIYIQDQERSAGKLANQGIEQYEYKSRVFVTEESYDNERTIIGYYPTDMGGLAYRAEFDRSVDVFEIMDMIIAVEL